MRRSFKHILSFAILLSTVSLAEVGQRHSDLLLDAQNNWTTEESDLWMLQDGLIQGRSRIFDGAKTDPEASAFLVSTEVFAGDIDVEMDVTFEKGRYLGLYLDFSPASQSGIWMATGHPLPEDAARNEVERGYIKTVDDSFWIVRATGELVIDSDQLVSLRFSRRGDDYSLYRDGRLIATYHKPGGYPAGHLQIRLTNASASIHRLQVVSEDTTANSAK